MNELARQIVPALLNAGVNFLAVDFDLTLVDEHTGGRWKGTPQELALKARPLFVCLIPEAIKSGICVAIVTFSSQARIVKGVLKQLFPDCSDNIVLRCEDKSWAYIGTASREGKQTHMASAAEELQSKFNIRISRNSTLLLDDDGKNIRIALANGVRAIQLKPDDPDRLICELLSLEAPPAGPATGN